MKLLGAQKVFELTGDKIFDYFTEQKTKMIQLAEKILGKGKLLKEENQKVHTVNVDEIFGLAKGSDKKENFGVALLEKAQQQSEKGNFTEAIQKLNTAIEITPENGNLYFERAEIFKTIGDYHQKILNNPDPTLKSLIKELSSTPGEDYRKALKDYTQYIKLNPENQKGYEARAVVYSELGLPGKAEKDLLQAQNLKEKFEKISKPVEKQLADLKLSKILKNEVHYMSQGIWIGQIKDGQAIGEGVFLQQGGKAEVKVGYIQGNNFNCRSLTPEEKIEVEKKIQAVKIEKSEAEKELDDGKYLTAISKNLKLLERDLGHGVLINAVGKVAVETEKLNYFSGCK